DKIKASYAAGYPLIEKEALADTQMLKEEGSLLRLTDSQGRFLARGYYGKQNKGLGWIWTRNEEESIDQAFMERKLAKSINRRQPYFDDPATTAFRVVNGEGDGFGGLTIDYYGGYYLLSWYSEGIYTFKKDIIAALQNVVEFKGIYEKKRFDTKGQYIEDDDFVA